MAAQHMQRPHRALLCKQFARSIFLCHAESLENLGLHTMKGLAPLSLVEAPAPLQSLPASATHLVRPSNGLQAKNGTALIVPR